MNRVYKLRFLAISLFCALAASISAAPGDLNPTFSGDGKLIDGTLTHSSEGASAVAIQADGKFVVAESGTSTMGSATDVTHANYVFLSLAGVTPGAVNAIAISGSNVYVGGTFNAAGDISVNYIAKWDGTTWSTLGSGMNGFVCALAVAGNGDLYGGGTFITAG